MELTLELNNLNKDNNKKISYCENCGEQNTMSIKLLGVDRIVPCLCSCRKAELEQ